MEEYHDLEKYRTVALVGMRAADSHTRLPLPARIPARMTTANDEPDRKGCFEDLRRRIDWLIDWLGYVVRTRCPVIYSRIHSWRGGKRHARFHATKLRTDPLSSFR